MAPTLFFRPCSAVSKQQQRGKRTIWKISFNVLKTNILPQKNYIESEEKESIPHISCVAGVAGMSWQFSVHGSCTHYTIWCMRCTGINKALLMNGM